MPRSAAKYGNRRVSLDGFTFDSQAEATRYGELRLLERTGEIRDIVVHPRLPLAVNNEIVAYYEPDFVYENALTGVKTYEDVKGVATAVYRLKKKLMWACWRIRVKEIKA